MKRIVINTALQTYRQKNVLNLIEENYPEEVEVEINESESDGLTSSEYYATCPTCDAELELEDEEVKNGHCICPKCDQSIDLE